MAKIDERLTAGFLAWERRGRGWDVYPYPVSPEPPFKSFSGHHLAPDECIDDGKRPTFASSLLLSLGRCLSGTKFTPLPPEEENEPEAVPFDRGTTIELAMYLPVDFSAGKDAFEQFIITLGGFGPFVFEFEGTKDTIVLRLVVPKENAESVEQQLHAFFPEIACVRSEDTLARAWNACSEAETAIVEFGLAEPFMRPLAAAKSDPFVGIVGALTALKEGELGLYQVTFEPVQADWADSIERSVTHADGKPFFVNAPELADEARKKAARPLYAAVVRIATRARDFECAWSIARNLAGAFRVFAHPNANELIPLQNREYPEKLHVRDLLKRQSRRSGMLLNLDELLGFVHLPSPLVCSPKFVRQITKTKVAPPLVTSDPGILFGYNTHLENTLEVRLPQDLRTKHCHIIGASGTGKSTLLFNLIRQDIDSGEGLAVLDPHGDLIDQILGIIPPERVRDVILLDPSDEDHSIGFNILSAHSDLEKTLLASDLVSVFQRLSTSWGDQMGSVLNNAILAFLESSSGGTLADLRRFLIEPAYRERFLQTVADPDIVYYWKKGFTQLTGNKSVGPILTRLDSLLSPKPIRYMLSQPKNRLDFAHILDTGKILLARLPQGAIGKENSFLLGSLVMTKLQQTAMARQRQEASKRRSFWIYVDEFHHFITPSTTEILSGARKYKTGLTLAHQELKQLDRDPELASAVMSNCSTRICFRVGDQDARTIANGFSFFEAPDIQNLGTGQAICRVERSAYDFNLSVPLPALPDEEAASARRMEVINVSRKTYATPRTEIEARIRESSIVSAPTSAAEPPALKPQLVHAVEQVTAPLPVPVAPSAPSPPSVDPPLKPNPLSTDAGRGGAQHKAIQNRLKKVAEELGYTARLEYEVLDKRGSVDLALSKAGRDLACEISLTTTIDHEVGNVVKCLKAGFPAVAVVCVDRKRLDLIKAANLASLGPADSVRISYYLPDELIEHLRAAAAHDVKVPPADEMRRGYKVKRVAPILSQEEAKAREEAAIKTIAEAMRRKTI